MRGLFVGGLVVNSEVDLAGKSPPAHYPESGGSGVSRYRLARIGRREASVVYAVYAAPDLADDEVERVVSERGYARRFDAAESRA